MTRRGLDATDRTLRDFISDHLMYLHLVYNYRNKQNRMAIVSVQSNVILGQKYLSSPRMASSIFIFGHNMTYYSKSIPFLLRFQEIFAKGKNRSGNFLSRQPPVEKGARLYHTALKCCVNFLLN
jgi:hypothetical protein